MRGKGPGCDWTSGEAMSPVEAAEMQAEIARLEAAERERRERPGLALALALALAITVALTRTLTLP